MCQGIAVRLAGGGAACARPAAACTQGVRAAGTLRAVLRGNAAVRRGIAIAPSFRREVAMIARNRTTKRTRKRLVRALVRRGTRTDHRPAAVGKDRPVRDRTVCRACGAVYVRKTWRSSPRRFAQATRDGARQGSCPACRIGRHGRAFGVVRLEGPDLAAVEVELRRRIAHVAERATFTQPERRVLDIVARGDALEVLTTSQELAHRIAHELAKAFRGSVTYRWSDADGRLLATWRRD
jgi:hypothetical protein